VPVLDELDVAHAPLELLTAATQCCAVRTSVGEIAVPVHETSEPLCVARTRTTLVNPGSVESAMIAAPTERSSLRFECDA
jgi:hypothetical protein